MDSLQRNQIYLGDAYELIKEVPDKSIDLIITDPPYLYTTAKKEAVTLTRAEALAKAETMSDYRAETMSDYRAETMSDYRAEIRKIANRLQIQSISGGFDFSLLDTLDAKMKGINIYLWCSVHQLYPLLGHYLGKGCLIDVLTWHKTNCSPLANGTYLNDTEYCVYAHDHGIAVGGDRKSKVKWYVTCTNQFDKRLYDHPTIKPLNIIENLVRNSSSRGGAYTGPVPRLGDHRGRGEGAGARLHRLRDRAPLLRDSEGQARRRGPAGPDVAGLGMGAGRPARGRP